MRPSGPPARQVAGAVEARARPAAERVGHEALGGEVRAAEVAARQPGAADAELARHAERHRLGRRRRARRARCWRRAARASPTAAPAATRVHAGPDRGLGRAVEVPQLAAARRAGASASGAAAPRRRTAPSGPAQPCQPASQQQRARWPAWPASPWRRRSPARAGQAPAVGGHVARPPATTRAAGDQRQEELERRDVEREGGDGEQHVVRRQPGALLHRAPGS